MATAKNLSESKLGFGIAALAGIPAGLLGIIASPLVLFLLGKAISTEAKPVGLRWIVWGVIGIPAVPTLIGITALISGIIMPAALNDQDKARIAAAESTVMSAARICATVKITGDAFVLPDGVSGSCTGTSDTFESAFPELRVQAQARTDSNGSVVLTRKALK